MHPDTPRDSILNSRLSTEHSLNHERGFLFQSAQIQSFGKNRHRGRLRRQHQLSLEQRIFTHVCTHVWMLRHTNWRQQSQHFRCVAFIGLKQYVFTPIQCWVPKEWPTPWEEYAENYCWVQDTYFTDAKMKLPFPKTNTERSAAQISKTM